MGRETIEYNDSASRVKLFMVKETSSVSSVDQSSRMSSSTTVPVAESSSHRSSLFTQFAVLSPRLAKETEEEQRRRRGGESNRDTKTKDAAARKTEDENETRAKGRQLTSFVIYILALAFLHCKNNYRIPGFLYPTFLILCSVYGEYADQNKIDPISRRSFEQKRFKS
jgi:hypothetical protein